MDAACGADRGKLMARTGLGTIRAACLTPVRIRGATHRVSQQRIGFRGRMRAQLHTSSVPYPVLG